MFERYTEQAKRAIENARNEAATRGAEHIAPSHLLLGLSQDESSRAAQIAALKGRLSGFLAGTAVPDRIPHPDPDQREEQYSSAPRDSYRTSPRGEGSSPELEPAD